MKQARKFVQEYIEEFYQVLIRIGHAEVDEEKVACYLNGLRPSILKELSLVQMNSIEESYLFSLRVEDKLSKKFDNKNSGRGCGGSSDGRSYGGQNVDQKNKDEAGSSSQN